LEADWEFELGNDAPLIDAHWPGFVDLRAQPELADQIVEADQVMGLKSALLALNQARSPVWTSKCDVWPVYELDPDELDAPSDAAMVGMACYIDLLPKNAEDWASPDSLERACRTLCGGLRAAALRGCRVDLVVRTARVVPDEYTLGMTVYVVGCGPTQAAAKERLSLALTAFAESALAAWPRNETPSQ
jgi:hypothetical protein